MNSRSEWGDNAPERGRQKLDASKSFKQMIQALRQKGTLSAHVVQTKLRLSAVEKASSANDTMLDLATDQRSTFLWRLARWPAVFAVELILFVTARVYSVHATEAMPTRFNITGSEFVNFRGMAADAEIASVLTGFNVFLLWFNMIGFANRYFVAAQAFRAPRATFVERDADENEAMRFKNAMVVWISAVFYSGLFVLVFVGCASAYLVIFGTRVSAFRDLNNAMAMVLSGVGLATDDCPTSHGLEATLL